MAPLERTLPYVAVVTILLLFSTSLSSACDDCEDLNDERRILKYLELTLQAVEKSLLYIGRHIQKLNIDGLIGVREIESKFSVLIADMWPDLPPKITRKVRDLVTLAQEVGERSEKVVRKATPHYFERSSQTVSRHFWDLMFPYQQINSSIIRIVPDSQRKTFTEEESDDCLDELYGTGSRPRCKISKTCWKRMTGNQYKYYSLTHEVFYLLNGISASCQLELEAAAQKYSGKHVFELMDYFCANVYGEALLIEKRKFPPELMDLFMEQIGLCGAAGYLEIAKWKWLPRIFDVQRPNGCFGTLPGETVNPKNFDPNSYGKHKRSFVVRKRVEQLMSPDGCLSHRVSVALSALAVYVRRLMEHLCIHVRN